MRLFLLAALLVAGSLAGYAVSAADYTRDGGTADWMCCTDRACTQIVSQHADEVRAFKACEALTDRDGVTRYTRSNAFRITKVVVTNGQAVLSWTPPTRNVDGTLLTDLAGYRIHYWQSPTQLIQTVQIANPSTTRHTVTNLAPGVWYFAIRAYTPTAQSDPSNVASKSAT